MKWNTDLQQIYRTYFNEPYVVPQAEERVETSRLGTPYMTKMYGRDVFLPVSLYAGEGMRMDIECATINVSGSKNVVKTQLSERRGTVKEVFTIDDYTFNISGVLIARDGRWADDQITMLRDLYETATAVELHNALSDIFLQESKRICITSLSFYNSGGRIKDVRHVPFQLTALSDYVETLDMV